MMGGGGSSLGKEFAAGRGVRLGGADKQHNYNWVWGTKGSTRWRIEKDLNELLILGPFHRFPLGPVVDSLPVWE